MPKPKPFVEGHDARRGVGRKAAPRPPKKPNVAEAAALAKGATPEEAAVEGRKGLFQPGHDPRRPTAEEWAAKAPRPGIARAAARLGWMERLPWLLDVVDGVPQKVVKRIREKDKEGKPTGQYVTVEYEETPSVDQRIEAYKVLGDMSGVKTMSFTDGEGDSLPQMPQWVFTNLTTEQLQQLEALSSLARPKALMDPSKEVRPG